MTASLRLFFTKLQQVQGQLPYLPKAVAMAWEAAPSSTLLWLGLLLVHGLLPLTTLYVTRELVDSLARALASDGSWTAMRATFFWIGAASFIMLSTEVLTSVTRWVRTGQSDLIEAHIRTLIQNKSAALDLDFYETPESYDQMYLACNEVHRPLALMENVGRLLQAATTLAGMVAVLALFSFWLPLALLASTLPAFYVTLVFHVRHHGLQLQQTRDERSAWYYDSLLTSGEPAAELRLFGIARYFSCIFKELRERLRKDKLDLEWNQTLAQLAAGTIGLAVTALAMGWVVWQAIDGRATLGTLALFYQAFSQGQRMTGALMEHAGQTYRNVLFLKNLFAFLSLEPKITGPTQPRLVPRPLRQGLKFEGVTFTYPNSDRAALDNFCLSVPVGQLVALVGPNGSGKSTLVKLLCRFYDPQRGRILLDGVDLRQFEIEDLRRQITALFQDPPHYHMTAANNIALGDLSALNRPKEIRYAALRAGADERIRMLPQDYGTVLGKRFGQTELSKGEWQRIALARTLLRKSPVIVLDEPTSAMDSWAEVEWLQRFRRIRAGATGIIITHRLTTAMRADVIHVIEAGKVVESGTHEQLVAAGGRYAHAWNAGYKAAQSASVSVAFG